MIEQSNRSVRVSQSQLKVKVFQPVNEERMNAWLGDGAKRHIHALHVSAGGDAASSICVIQYEDIPEPRARDYGFPSVR